MSFNLGADNRRFRITMNARWEQARWEASLTRYGEKPPVWPKCSCWYAMNGDLEKRDPECPTHGGKTSPMSKPLSPEAINHQALLRNAMLAGAILQPFDIDEALRAIDQADSFGPLLHPSEWIQNRKAMQLDRELLEAARPLAALARRRMEELTARYAKELEQVETLAAEVTRP